MHAHHTSSMALDAGPEPMSTKHQTDAAPAPVSEFSRAFELFLARKQGWRRTGKGRQFAAKGMAFRLGVIRAMREAYPVYAQVANVWLKSPKRSTQDDKATLAKKLSVLKRPERAHRGAHERVSVRLLYRRLQFVGLAIVEFIASERKIFSARSLQDLYGRCVVLFAYPRSCKIFS